MGSHVGSWRATCHDIWQDVLANDSAGFLGPNPPCHWPSLRGNSPSHGSAMMIKFFWQTYWIFIDIYIWKHQYFVYGFTQITHEDITLPRVMVVIVWTRYKSWWRHQMETFSALLAICAGNSSVPGEFPAQRPVTRNFDVFFDLRLNKRLSKQSWGWWFETLSRPLWRHCNVWLLWNIQSSINVDTGPWLPWGKCLTTRAIPCREILRKMQIFYIF